MAHIPNPKSLTALQCNDGIKYCKLRIIELRKSAKGLRRVHNRNCLVRAEDLGDKDKVKRIKQNINREEGKVMWYVINKATDDPRLGTTN